MRLCAYPGLSRRSLTAVAAGLACFSLMAPAALAAARPIEVLGAWSRPTVGFSRTGVVYLSLVNRGPPDRLIGASTPVAAQADLHRSVIRNGIASMEPVPGGVDLPPGRPVKLEAGGLHLMLSGLKRVLSAGSDFPLTLRFAHAPPLTVRVAVHGGAGPPPMAGMHM